ncbi:hypothetical protein BGY98DRAFT_1174103 [Russula aff. rugulosa BPL654]|nr:hypothetical protein BGY98DRAFT_1174103 [Russula aff. rugulosa BPL654]
MAMDLSLRMTRHVYPIKKSLKHVYDVLKGSDAVVYQSKRVLGFDPVLYVYYEGDEDYSKPPPHGAMADRVISFGDNEDEATVLDTVQGEGGIPARRDDLESLAYLPSCSLCDTVSRGVTRTTNTHTTNKPQCQDVKCNPVGHTQGMVAQGLEHLVQMWEGLGSNPTRVTFMFQ